VKFYCRYYIKLIGLLVRLPVLSSFCTRKFRRWRNVPSGTSSPAGCPGQSPESCKMVEDSVEFGKWSGTCYGYLLAFVRSSV